MYTVQETLDHINNLDGWGHFIDRRSVENREVVVWAEEVDNDSVTAPWRTAYLVRYWQDGEWQDTRSFYEEWTAREFATDFVNGPNKIPYPTV